MTSGPSHAIKAKQLGGATLANIKWIAAAGALALGGCGEQASEPAGDIEVIEPSAPPGAAGPVTPATAWNYNTDLDAMTDRPTHVACSTSTNLVRLQSPYSDVGARLCIRQSPQHGLDAYVALLGDGQIICRSYDNCSIKVRFGDGEQQSFGATDAADGSSNIVFVTNAQRFVSEVKTAPITRVQLTFYQAGVQVVEFNTAGLVWPRPSA